MLNTATVNSLPVEILIHIFAVLAPADRLTALKVSKIWNITISDDISWKAGFLYYFGGAPWKRCCGSWIDEYLMYVGIQRIWNRRNIDYSDVNPSIGQISIACDLKLCENGDGKVGVICASIESGYVVQIENQKVGRNVVSIKEDAKIDSLITVVLLSMDHIAVGFLNGQVAVLSRINGVHGWRTFLNARHQNRVTHLAWTGNSALVSASADCIYVWDLKTAECLKSGHVPLSSILLLQSSSTKLLACLDSGIVVSWDLSNPVKSIPIKNLFKFDSPTLYMQLGYSNTSLFACKEKINVSFENGGVIQLETCAAEITAVYWEAATEATIDSSLIFIGTAYGQILIHKLFCTVPQHSIQLSQITISSQPILKLESANNILFAATDSAIFLVSCANGQVLYTMSSQANLSVNVFIFKQQIVWTSSNTLRTLKYRPKKVKKPKAHNPRGKHTQSGIDNNDLKYETAQTLSESNAQHLTRVADFDNVLAVNGSHLDHNMSPRELEEYVTFLSIQESMNSPISAAIDPTSARSDLTEDEWLQIALSISQDSNR